MAFLPSCWLKDRTTGQWLPFAPWPAQSDVAGLLAQKKQVVILKARQLGLTWLTLAYALYRMVQDGITVLLFSQRDEEAKDLASRLSGMYERLPPYLAGKIDQQSTHSLKLSNGAEAISFPTTGGRSYTAGLVVVDEADHVPDLEKLLNAVAPTVADGGQLVLISSPDKSQPDSTFKRIYRAARSGENDYHPVFLPWSARPGRTPEWYARQSRDVFAQTGRLDDLHQEYPATDEEALARPVIAEVFRREWFNQRLEALPVGCSLVRYWDKAYTQDAGCYTAGVLMARTPQGRFIVVDVRRAQLTSHEREALIRATAEDDRQRYGYVTIWIEQEPAGIGRELAETTIRNLAGFDARADRATGDKVTRAQPFAGQCGVGNVQLLRGPWNPVFVDECCEFPAGPYLDQVDAASGAFAKLAGVADAGATVGAAPPRPVPAGVFGNGGAGNVGRPPPGVFGR